MRENREKSEEFFSEAGSAQGFSSQSSAGNYCAGGSVYANKAPLVYADDDLVLIAALQMLLWDRIGIWKECMERNTISISVEYVERGLAGI